MKLILDLDSIADAHKALAAYMDVTRQVPQQKVGEQIGALVQGQKFSVTKNQGSFTVKVVK